MIGSWADVEDEFRRLRSLQKQAVAPLENPANVPFAEKHLPSTNVFGPATGGKDSEKAKLCSGEDGRDGKDGETGPRGAQGEKGEKGDPAPSTTINGRSGAVTLAQGTGVTIAENPQGTFTISSTATGGGSSAYWGTSPRTGSDPTLHDNYRPVNGPHILTTERTNWQNTFLEVVIARTRENSNQFTWREFPNLKAHLAEVWNVLTIRTLNPNDQTAGKVAVTTGTGRTEWQVLPGSTGNAGGDLSGTYPNPVVAKLQGRAVSATSPAVGQVLKWDGAQWAPAADAISSSGGAGQLSFREVVGITSDIAQTDDVILLNASVVSTTLTLRGTLSGIAGNKCFDIRRTDTNTSNTCYLELALNDGAEFPDGNGTPVRYAMPPRGGVRLSAYKAPNSSLVLYQIIAAFNAGV